MKSETTIEQKLYQAHELLREVLQCSGTMDTIGPLHYDLVSAQNSIFLAGRNLPRNVLNYVPRLPHVIIGGIVSPNIPRKKTFLGVLKNWLDGNYKC